MQQVGSVPCTWPALIWSPAPPIVLEHHQDLSLSAKPGISPENLPGMTTKKNKCILKMKFILKDEITKLRWWEAPSSRGIRCISSPMSVSSTWMSGSFIGGITGTIYTLYIFPQGWSWLSVLWVLLLLILYQRKAHIQYIRSFSTTSSLSQIIVTLQRNPQRLFNWKNWYLLAKWTLIVIGKRWLNTAAVEPASEVIFAEINWQRRLWSLQM